jgi:hypothetical protein
MQLMKAKQSIKDIIHIQLVYTCLEVQYLEINKQVLLCPLVIDRTRKMAWFNILNTLRETQTSKQGIGRLSDTTDQAPINITYEKEDIYHGQAA